MEKEDRRKAYRYGKQLVPFDDADILKYSPSRGIQLIGFVPAGSIARHNFMKVFFLVLVLNLTLISSPNKPWNRPSRGIRLNGFVPAGSIARQNFMKVSLPFRPCLHLVNSKP